MSQTAILEHSGDGATDSVEIDSQSASLGDARHIVARYLAERCPWADAGAVALVLSELLANAVRHAGGWWRVRATGDNALLVIEVRDRSEQQPRLLAPDLDEASGGLGMHINGKLSTRFEVEPEPGQGKVVRATWERAQPTAGQGTGSADNAVISDHAVASDSTVGSHGAASQDAMSS